MEIKNLLLGKNNQENYHHMSFRYKIAPTYTSKEFRNIFKKGNQKKSDIKQLTPSRRLFCNKRHCFLQKRFRKVDLGI